MKEYEFVRVRIDDHIMSVTINRPEVYNAVHPPLSLELNEIWLIKIPFFEAWRRIILRCKEFYYFKAN